MFPDITIREFHQAAVDSRFSYLFGVYLRYGREPFKYRIANSSHKIDLIVEFIEDLGREWVQVYRSLRRVPAVFEISFGPGSVFKRFFETNYENA
jgi:hypothetical protein